MKNKKVAFRLLAIIVQILFWFHDASAQSQVDSLKTLLAQPASDTVRLQQLDLLVNLLGPTEEGKTYNETMGVLSKSTMLSNDPETARSGRRHYAGYLGNSGYIAEISGDIPAALKFYGEAQEIVKIDENPIVEASLLNNIAYIYEGLGDIPKAVQYYQSSLHIRDSINDQHGIATCYNNLAVIYRDQGEYDQALEYFQKFNSVSREINDSSGTTLALANIGTLYSLQGDTTQGRTYLLQALDLSNRIHDEKETGHALYGLGMISLSQKNYPAARQYFEDAIVHQKAAGHKRSMTSSMFQLAETHLLLGESEKALSIALEAHEIAQKTGYVELIATSASTLKKIYKELGKDSLALVMFELEVKMRDSIKNETNRKIIVRNALENEFLQKQQELEQKSERETLIRNAALIGMGVVLIFLGFVWVQRNRISRERKRSDDLLLNILPSKVAEELKEKGRAEAQAFDEVTILFTDFKEFTQISEKLSPVDLVRELDFCFAAFDKIVEQHGIEKIKTTGDAYMAAGGVPVPSRTNAIDTVKAARAICDFMIKHKQQRDAEGKPTFEIRIGVHTGPVVAGIVGLKKFAYDIWGDSVNTASRMESSGEAGKVNISESTYQRVKEVFACTYRGKVSAKHKGEIAMYFVDGVNA